MPASRRTSRGSSRVPPPARPPTRRRARRSVVLLGLAALGVALAACGGGNSASTTTSTTAATTSTTASATSTTASSASNAVTISTRTVPKLGTILVDSAGRTLYVFAPDKRTKVTCNPGCQAVWPPVKLPSGHTPVAKGGVRASLLGSDPNPEGGRVVTYNGWPLYTYVADSAPGMAKGQAINLNGGLWFVLSPTGVEIKTTP